MQSYTPLKASDYLDASREVINNNIASVASDFSGTAFPTTNLVAGMTCDRTDQKKVYRLQTDLKTWMLLYDYSSGSVAVTSASKATALATARTINGTSFNGSSNITTANWGTARNISIADATAANTGTAVSVNGSGNVVLKLPATIVAALSGNATSATTATKLGSTTVGSTSKPIYLNAGAATALSATVGGTAKPIYSNAGTLTALSATVGGTAKPIYSNAGTLTALSATVGSASKPIYLNAGTLTACADSIGGGGIVAALLEQNGYVKFANGLIIQWGVIEATRGDSPTITFPMAYTSFAAPMITQTRHHLGDGFILGVAQDSITLTGFSTKLDQFANAGFGTSQKIIWHSFGV